MPGLSQGLYQRCRDALLQCREFDTTASLYAVFVSEELHRFRSGLPEAASRSGRVDQCLDYLLPQHLSGGLPVLPLFLAALRDRYQPGDALRDELEALTEAVRLALSPAESGLSPRSSRSPASQAQPEWDTSAIRDLLTAAFSDEELEFVCYDCFRSVYEQFTGGMSRRQKVQRLIEHCERSRSLDELLRVVRERNPAQFARFDAQLGLR